VVSPRTERRPTLLPLATTQNAEETLGIPNDRLRRLIRDYGIQHIPQGQALIVVVDDVIAAIRQHGVGGRRPVANDSTAASAGRDPVEAVLAKVGYETAGRSRGGT
jgi:hypothetical protein